MDILSALAAFASYFFSGFAMILVFLFVYTRITPHDEWALIKADNQSAAFAFIGACPGYVIPLGQRGDQLDQPAGLPAVGRSGAGGATAAVRGREDLHAAHQRQDRSEPPPPGFSGASPSAAAC